MKFTDELYEAAIDIWEEYLEHPFVKGIGDGTLDKEKFKTYLIQDYLYLVDYVKVFAMGIVKARNVEEMKLYYSAIEGILEDETQVHTNYLKYFGLTPEETEKCTTKLTTASYTSYMLGIALKGDIKEIAMTIMPCNWTYHFIGSRLKEKYADVLEDNFYKEWIEEYGSEEFKHGAEVWIDYIDEICENATIAEKEKLKEIFIKSSQFEMQFWNMAYGIQD